MQNAGGMPLKYPGMGVEELYEFTMSTFFGKDASMAHKTTTLANPILNRALHKQDCCDRDGVVAHYSYEMEF